MDRHAWQEAFDLLTNADHATSLSADDLEALSLAAFFIARPDVQQDAKERAFKQHESAGNLVRAAYLAADIARYEGYAGKHSIASAWKRRAERLIGADGDTYAHGYLALVGSEMATVSGDLEAALRLAERAVRARDGIPLRRSHRLCPGQPGPAEDRDRRRDRRVRADGGGVDRRRQRRALAVRERRHRCRMIWRLPRPDRLPPSHRVDRGHGVVLRPPVAGRVSRRLPDPSRRGQRRPRRVGTRGAGAGSGRPSSSAAFNAAPNQAEGYYAIGDIRRLRGDFAGAEAAAARGARPGRSPQPALALIRLAQGKTAGRAHRDQRRRRRERTGTAGRAARLLPAQVEIAVAAGDVALARAAVDELGATDAGLTVAGPRGRPPGRRWVGSSLPKGDGGRRGQALRCGHRGWREVRAPYEVARARAVLSSGALGWSTTRMTPTSSCGPRLEEFRRLGAAVDAAAAEREPPATPRSGGPARRTCAMTFMFTDIVGSTALAEALGDSALGAAAALARRHAAGPDRHGRRRDRQLDRRRVLRRVRRRPRGRRRRDRDPASPARPSRRHRFRDPRPHRAPHGRRQPARRRLLGMGVHVAARGALATGGEILATSETIAEAGDVEAIEPRTVSVKGVTVPLNIAAVGWDAA